MFRRPVVRRAGVGLIGTTVVAGTMYAAGSRNAQRNAQERTQEERLAELEAEQTAAPRQAAAPPQAPDPPAPPTKGPISADERMRQLQQLGELKKSGVLTDPEFEQQKRRILAS